MGSPPAGSIAGRVPALRGRRGQEFRPAGATYFSTQGGCRIPKAAKPPRAAQYLVGKEGKSTPEGRNTLPNGFSSPLDTPLFHNGQMGPCGSCLWVPRGSGPAAARHRAGDMGLPMRAAQSRKAGRGGEPERPEKIKSKPSIAGSIWKRTSARRRALRRPTAARRRLLGWR